MTLPEVANSGAVSIEHSIVSLGVCVRACTCQCVGVRYMLQVKLFTCWSLLQIKRSQV